MAEEKQGKMEPKAKKAWVKALRSGKWKQAINKLFLPVGTDKSEPSEPSYCCLGVLYKLRRHRNPTEAYMDHYRSKLSPAMLKSCRLTGTTQEELVMLNDNGSSFSEIADWIEKNL